MYGRPGLAWGTVEDFLRKGLLNWALKTEKELKYYREGL